MGHWATKKVVVRDFYISFKPMGADPGGSDLDLSEPISNQASDEAIYVAVTGRPAGLWNFIRELIGLSRRFEFVMSASQCIQRLGSPSTQILSSSHLQGLNTITVGLFRPLIQAILITTLSLSLVVVASYKPDVSSLENLTTTSVATAGQEGEGDGSYVGQGDEQAVPSEAEASQLPVGDAPSGAGMMLTALNVMLLSVAPAWAWFVLALGLGIYAAYLFFIDKRNLVEVSESGEVVVGFIVSPSFLEKRSTDIPLEELNRLPMIFRVLKDK